MDDFSFEALDQSARKKAGAENIPVRILRYELGKGLAIGERIDVEPSSRQELAFRLNPEKTDRVSRFSRPDLTKISRKVDIGGVVRFDRSVPGADGIYGSDWPTILTNRDNDHQAALVGEIRVRPYRAPRTNSQMHRVGLELIWPGTTYALSSKVHEAGRHTQIVEAVINAIFVPDTARPWGTPCAWFRIEHGDQSRVIPIVLQFTDDGPPKPILPHLDSYIPRAELQTLSAALDAGVGAGVRVSLTQGRVFYWGRDLVLDAIERNKPLPDRWYLQADGETLFTRSSLAIRKRVSGSWFFTEVLPIMMPTPVFRSADDLISGALQSSGEDQAATAVPDDGKAA